MRRWGCRAVKLLGLLLAVMVCFLVGNNKKILAATQGLHIQNHSQEEIRNYVKNNGSTLDDNLAFGRIPVLDIPYDAGQLSDATQQSALNMVKQIRYIAGISDQVTVSEEYSRYAQAASLVNYLNGNISHSPQQPSGMGTELFQTGYEGASKSNLAMTGRNGNSINQTIAMLLMKDGDSSNISRVGHRRWLLNPKMGKIGFGAVSGTKGTYSSVYVLDKTNAAASETGVAWPAQNMPVEYFAADFPWSISLGYMVNADMVHVALTRKSDNKTWNFSKTASDGEFYVDNSEYSYTYGENGCIIFRPPAGDISSYHAGDTYEVKITGIDDPVAYTVSFFNLYNNENDVGNNPGTENGSDEKKEYTVLFSANGGMLIGNNIQQTVNQKIDNFPSASRDGYTFNGWFTSASGGSRVTALQNFSSDTTLYAQWTENTVINGFLDLTVSGITDVSADITARISRQYVRSWWMLYGKSSENMVSTQANVIMSECDSFSFHYGASGALLEPDTVYYVQYCFINSDGTIVKSDIKSFKTMASAVQSREYTVTFYANGGVCGTSTLRTSGGKLAELPAASRNGYIFKGWFTSPSGGKQVTVQQIFSADMALYAQWAENTAETGFSDVAVSDITSISAEVTAKIPRQFVRSWRVYYGRNENAMISSDTKEIMGECDTFRFHYGSSSVPLVSDTVYYVQFCFVNSTGTTIKSDLKSFRTLKSANTVTEYMVTFDANGGTCSTSVMRTSGRKLADLPVPVRSGYTFDGWYTSPVAGNRILSASIYDKDCILYAHWTYVEPSSSSGNSSSGIGTDSGDKKTPVTVQKVKGVSVKNSGKGKITVKWKWYLQGKGYQIACSTSKKFPSGKTKIKSAGEYDEIKTISGLKEGKTYYVKVRAYKKVGSKKYYGSWSSIKKVKIKK